MIVLTMIYLIFMITICLQCLVLKEPQRGEIFANPAQRAGFQKQTCIKAQRAEINPKGIARHMEYHFSKAEL